MGRTKVISTGSKASLARQIELRRSLEARRSELVTMVHNRMRNVRKEHETDIVREGVDDGEASDIFVQEDIELALIQMRAETLARIDEALARLNAGTYGYCASCEEEIATPRLRALPFAVRCRECQERDETERGKGRADQGRPHPFLAETGSLRDPAVG